VILLIFLGDWRAALVVAVTIPLWLLFGCLWMGAFGISVNLMSLGAIDFGLIVDGAVIIVEGYQAKDGSTRINGTDLTFPDGKKLFLGSSGTGAPYDDKK